MKLRSFKDNTSGYLSTIVVIVVFVSILLMVDFGVSGDDSLINNFKPPQFKPVWQDSPNNDPAWWQLDKHIENFITGVQNVLGTVWNSFATVWDTIVFFFQIVYLDIPLLYSLDKFIFAGFNIVLKLPIWFGMGYAIIKAFPTT